MSQSGQDECVAAAVMESRRVSRLAISPSHWATFSVLADPSRLLGSELGLAVWGSELYHRISLQIVFNSFPLIFLSGFDMSLAAGCQLPGCFLLRARYLHVHSSIGA
jgi:hypothetical protein